jgi:membrane protein DedA with SNARE-associated domain
MNLVLMIVVALAASVLADYLWYLAGTVRKGMMGRLLGRHPDSRVLRIAEEFVTLHGSRALLLAKFVPGLSLAAPR